MLLTAILRLPLPLSYLTPAVRYFYQFANVNTNQRKQAEFKKSFLPAVTARLREHKASTDIHKLTSMREESNSFLLW